MKISKICVYCASSRQCDPVYYQSAHQLGKILAKESITTVYGGGAVGLMGHLANGVLAEGGEVVGVIPKFMFDLEWGHPDISQLKIVEDMNIRKNMMLKRTDAAIALPGGSGTFEELFETITKKRLGFYTKPIILLNMKGFFDPCIQMLNLMVDERFMDERHRLMWTVVSEPDQVLPAIRTAPKWSEDARSFAAI